MSTTDTEQILEAPTAVAEPTVVADPTVVGDPTVVSDPSPPGFETCEQCAAPVDANQRYCVVCGTRRKHVHDPAARYMAGATSHTRTVRTVRPVGSGRRSAGLGTALILAAIPLAVAAGVLIGRPGSDVNSKLLAALRAQKPTVVNVAGGGSSGSVSAAASTTSAATSAPAARLTSTFSLTHGYAVELQTLPGAGITQAKVAAAEQRARSHGAPAVGLINQADFRITPAPPAGDYVIYSGQYASASAANTALGKLRHAFPSAKVIAVRSVTVAASGPVLSTTGYGSAHQVTGFKPNAAQLASGAQTVNKISKEITNNYVKSQQGLPDAISVP